MRRSQRDTREWEGVELLECHQHSDGRRLVCRVLADNVHVRKAPLHLPLQDNRNRQGIFAVSWQLKLGSILKFEYLAQRKDAQVNQQSRNPPMWSPPTGGTRASRKSHICEIWRFMAHFYGISKKDIIRERHLHPRQIQSELPLETTTSRRTTSSAIFALPLTVKNLLCPEIRSERAMSAVTALEDIVRRKTKRFGQYVDLLKACA